MPMLGMAADIESCRHRDKHLVANLIPNNSIRAKESHQ
jgi:hypothetical protein